MQIKTILYKKIKQLFERVKHVKKRSIYCIVAGLILAFVSFLLNRESIYIRPYEIERSSYGTQKTPYKLNLDAENLINGMEFSVSVSPRKYDKEEADKIFLEKLEALKLSILLNNNDFEHINTKLNFLSDLGDGVKASYSFNPQKGDKEDFRYYVKYQGLIDGSGNVKNEDFKIDEICDGFIEVQLSTEIKDKESPYKSEKFMLPVRVVSRDMDAIESFKVAFKKAFDEKDKETINENIIKLPEVVNNFRIRYKEKLNLSFLLMPLFGILTAILLEARDKEVEKERIKRRIRYLEIDYTQIITKILLYVSSGMTIRNSMIRLAEVYQKEELDKEKYNERVAYKELIIVRNKLLGGYSEVRAYEEMAKNINLRTYTRFLNIIIQSIKNGNKELKNILNMEVQDALYERKQHAKKLGEEAATKLVLPLMMMLAIIMVIIMVPAFMGM